MKPLRETVDLRTLWDGAVLGDTLPWHKGWPCGSPASDQLQCTRQLGHEGQHVATAERRVVGVWPGEQRS